MLWRVPVLVLVFAFVEGNGEDLFLTGYPFTEVALCCGRLRAANHSVSFIQSKRHKEIWRGSPA